MLVFFWKLCKQNEILGTSGLFDEIKPNRKILDASDLNTACKGYLVVPKKRLCSILFGAVSPGNGAKHGVGLLPAEAFKHSGLGADRCTD